MELERRSSTVLTELQKKNHRSDKQQENLGSCLEEGNGEEEAKNFLELDIVQQANNNKQKKKRKKKERKEKKSRWNLSKEQKDQPKYQGKHAQTWASIYGLSDKK